MSDLERGTVLKGKFEIGEKKGQGSLKEDIYHGRHLELDRDIVIRVLPSNAPMSDEVTQRFIQGIQLSATLQHPNMVSVLDAGEEQGLKYFVTNYEKGFYLNEYLDQRGKLDETEAIRLVKGLADALDYVWKEQQIVHRNICPGTILIARGNVPMLTDFGLAKSLENDNKLTMQGYAVGDPVYMSPEQAKGSNVDYRSDIYCLGLVFYQLLAGYPPFRDKSTIEIMQEQISGAHKPIQGANENITDACAAVIDKMLAKNIEERYQSWDDAVNDLDAILNHKTPTALKKAPSKEMQEKIRRETEQKVGKKYQKAMNQVKQELAKDTKRRFKRNVIIVTILLNIIVIAGFFYYLKWKKEQSLKNQPTKEKVLSR